MNFGIIVKAPGHETRGPFPPYCGGMAPVGVFFVTPPQE